MIYETLTRRHVLDAEYIFVSAYSNGNKAAVINRHNPAFAQVKEALMVAADEQKKKEEEEARQKRYEQFLKLKEEFQSDILEESILRYLSKFSVGDASTISVNMILTFEEVDNALRRLEEKGEIEVADREGTLVYYQL